ncbi:hypothetical protein T06_2034 [Trichinella sp. T6]|nr:hypothetical protein T06_2034 [Trichinella sp. T6]
MPQVLISPSSLRSLVVANTNLYVDSICHNIKPSPAFVECIENLWVLDDVQGKGPDVDGSAETAEVSSSYMTRMDLVLIRPASFDAIVLCDHSCYILVSPYGTLAAFFDMPWNISNISSFYRYVSVYMPCLHEQRTYYCNDLLQDAAQKYQPLRE